LSNTIAIIDYGMGNLHSVAKALTAVAPRHRVLVTSDRREISSAERVVLPGVGAIGACMDAVQKARFDELIPTIVNDKPLLGICVGMQLLFDSSEESNGVQTLGLCAGQVKSLIAQPETTNLKVPHMGWNSIKHDHHPLFSGVAQDAYVYFVHSYYAQAKASSDVIARCNYGVDMDVAITRGNVVATQFHPEKSGSVGLKILENFVNWEGMQ